MIPKKCQNLYNLNIRPNKLRRDYAPINYFISKTLEIENPNVIFDNKLEEIEYKGQRYKYYYAKVTYTPGFCESCGVLNTNYSIVKNGFKSSRITIPKVSEMNVFLILRKAKILL
ncbi:hypothetical protein [Staphylococcus xylosus]|uniref:hypothetical protein n=1 Tax=Staphylococcus xylosus TaxID=1288 RepID=UPI003F546166